MVTVYEKGDADAPADGKPFSCPSCGTGYLVHDPDAVPGVPLQFDFKCAAKGCKYKAGVGLA